MRRKVLAVVAEGRHDGQARRVAQGMRTSGRVRSWQDGWPGERMYSCRKTSKGDAVIPALFLPVFVQPNAQEATVSFYEQVLGTFRRPELESPSAACGWSQSARSSS